MCIVSMIGDDWGRRVPERYPWVLPRDVQIIPSWPSELPNIKPAVSREEFDALKKDVAALRELLLAAKKYDEATGQPDCEVDDKVTLIRQLAKLVGVDMSAVFPEAFK